MKVYLKAFLVTSIVSAIFLTAFWYWRQTQFKNDNSDRLSVIDRLEKVGVEDFPIVDINKKNYKFVDFKNKVVIVNFWASWCGPCVEEVPSMIKLVQEMNGKVQLLAISGDSSLEDISVFLKSFPEINNPNVIVTWDQTRSLMKMFDVARLPESFIIGKDGKLVKKIVGTINWYTKDSITYMNELIEAKAN